MGQNGKQSTPCFKGKEKAIPISDQNVSVFGSRLKLPHPLRQDTHIKERAVFTWSVDGVIHCNQITQNRMP